MACDAPSSEAGRSARIAQRAQPVRSTRRRTSKPDHPLRLPFEVAAGSPAASTRLAPCGRWDLLSCAPHGQRVRRLRGDERGLVRRRRGRQRRDARGDDAGDRRAGRRRFRTQEHQLAAQAQLPRIPDSGREVPRCVWPSCCTRWRATSARSRPSISCSGWPTRCPPACTPPRGSSVTCIGSVGPRADGRLPRTAPRLYITATDLDSCERVVFGAEALTTCRSPRPSAPRPPCR